MRFAKTNCKLLGCFEIYRVDGNAFKVKSDLYCWKLQFVPRSKHSVSVIKTSQLMLYREIIAVCSEIHTKYINTLCGQNVELLCSVRTAQ